MTDVDCEMDWLSSVDMSKPPVTASEKLLEPPNAPLENSNPAATVVVTDALQPLVVLSWLVRVVPTV